MDDESVFEAMRQLPNVVSQFHSFTQEEKRVQSHLTKLQNWIVKLKNEEEKLNSEIHQAERKNNIVLCEIKTTQNNIDDTESKIQKIYQQQNLEMIETYALQNKLDITKSKKEVLTAKLDTYNLQVESLSNNVLSDDIKVIASLQDKLNNVTSKSSQLQISIDSLPEEEINSVPSDAEEANNAYTTLERINSQLSESRSELAQVCQDAEVLQKRNSAQLIRLQRQLEELQSQVAKTSSSHKTTLLNVGHSTSAFR